MQILNKFASPAAEAVYRAFLITLATFAVSCLTTYQGLEALGLLRSERWEKAIIVGVIAALTPFVGRTLEGTADQRRAMKGRDAPADVPIFHEREVEAKVLGVR